MEKLKLEVEDIEDSTEYPETAKMLQSVYDRTGFLPSLYDCISPPKTERDIEDEHQVMRKPNEIDLYVAERWLHREGDVLVIWVTTKIIRPVLLDVKGKHVTV